MIRKARVVLEVTFDDKWSHPLQWDWSDLCDISGDEDVKAISSEDITDEVHA
jgi:hypothetical protein